MSHTCFKLTYSLNLPECQGNSFVNTWLLSGCNAIWTENHLVLKWTLNSLARLVNDWTVLWEIICMVNSTICSDHVTFKFQSESTLYSCLNVKELLAWNRCDIWSLSYFSAVWSLNQQLLIWSTNTQSLSHTS